MSAAKRSRISDSSDSESDDQCREGSSTNDPTFLVPWIDGTSDRTTPSLPSNRINIDYLVLSCITAPGGSYATAARHLNFHYQFDRDEPNTPHFYRSKVQQVTQKLRQKAINSSNEYFRKTPISGLYFDSKINTTIRLEKINGKNWPRKIKADHYTMISEPESNFIGVVTKPTLDHSTQKIGDASECAKQEMMDFFIKNNIPYGNIQVVGCDGTNSNVGHKQGIIRKMEEFLGKRLMRFICLFHFNELLGRSLMKNMVSRKLGCGPSFWSGDLGNAIRDDQLHNKKVANYHSIETNDYDYEFENNSDNSDDIIYLFRLYKAVKTGQCDDSLAFKKPGQVHNARWVNLGSRILRIYISMENPYEIDYLLFMTNYVMRVYAPMIFEIKLRPYCKYGPQHFCNFIAKTRYFSSYTENYCDDLSPNIKEKAKRCCENAKSLAPILADKVIRDNCHWAHPENVMLGMLLDHDLRIRSRVIKRILEIRKMEPSRTIFPDNSGREEEEGEEEEEEEYFDNAEHHAFNPKNEECFEDIFSDNDDYEDESEKSTSEEDEGVSDEDEQQNWAKLKPEEIRPFILPKAELNFNAKHYSELVPWENYPLQPPLLETVDDLASFQCPAYPCHTQKVEQKIQLVSMASQRTNSDLSLNGNMHLFKLRKSMEEDIEKGRKQQQQLRAMQHKKNKKKKSIVKNIRKSMTS